MNDTAAGIEASCRREALRGWFVVLLLMAAVVYAFQRLQVPMGQIPEGVRRLGWLAGLMMPPSAEGNAIDFLQGAGETLAIAFTGTTVAFAMAMPLGFLAARNVLDFGPLHFCLRRTFDLIRGIDTLIWGLIFVSAVGLGPFAGVLAIACSDVGVLAKLYAESIENADSRATEGLQATGANHLEIARFGILPQVLPVFLGNALYFLESNVRSASILGVVGAGGIGLQLSDRIRANEWPQTAFILVLILLMVAALDFVSARLRRRFLRSPDRRLLGAAV